MVIIWWEISLSNCNGLTKVWSYCFSSKRIKLWIDPNLKAIQARSKSPHSAISDVEYEVLVDIALGLTDNLIAERRYLSRRGAQNRLKSLYNKLDVSQDDNNKESLNLRTRAVSVAMRRGLINSFELENEEKAFQEWRNKNKISA